MARTVLPPDIHAEAEVTDDTETVTCRYCDGKGYVYYTDENREEPCRICHARGKWVQPVSVEHQTSND